MNKTRHHTPSLLAGAIALAFAGGSAVAGGPVGVIPFDGDGSGNGFTIDSAGFNVEDVTAAPCPAGATCVNGTATTGDMLMREIEFEGTRIMQTILVDTGGAQGDFIAESLVSAGGEADTFAGKVIIDDVARAFFTGQSFYRGELFGASSAGFTIAVDVHQDIGGGFQTFDMQTPRAPNANDNPPANYRMQILQNPAGQSPAFAHIVQAGTYVPDGGTLAITGAQRISGSPVDEITEEFANPISFAAGDRISATWIGTAGMFGGGPDILLADGQTQNHDARTPEQRDFGLLIYRVGGGTGTGDYGGLRAGVDAEFSQNAPTAELRGFSLANGQNSGNMYNVDHGSFIGGADLLADNWDEAVFGENPYGD